MTEYIPYSIRHDIPEGELAIFLDYCERDLGFDIRAQGGFDDIDYTYELGKGLLHQWYDGEIQFFYGELELRMPKELFFRTYRSLLPEIRNLY